MIYAGETWCRSLVMVETVVAVGLQHEERSVVRAARDALVDLLVLETGPVSLHLRLEADAVTVLARAAPGV